MALSNMLIMFLLVGLVILICAVVAIVKLFM